MKTNKVNLGKVCVTIDKDYWDINKDYDKLVIVEVENAYATYISRQPVPHGIDIENKEYWCLFSRYNKNYLANEGIFNVSKYLKIKDIVSNVVPLTLTEAIAACPSVVKNAGQIITFIDKNKEWQRYQYQGYNVEHWNQLTLWKDLNNVSEDIPVSEDVMVFNITEYMPGGSKYKQAIWAGIYTIDGITPVSQYRVIFGCDETLGEVYGVDMGISDTLAIIDIDTDEVTAFRYILFVGNSIDGYRYQTTINSYEDVPDWIAEAFGNNSSYILANIASLERRINTKLANKSSIIRVDDYLDNSKEMPNGYFMFEQQPVSQIRVLYDSDAYLLYIQAAVNGTGTMYFAFENFDEYYDSWRYLNQYTENNCPSHVLEAFGLNVATSNKKGMMSATDKTNLDGSFKNVNYNSTTKKLIFTKNNNATVELDATPFIKDGMVNSVSIVDGYLVITFNTDSGKETIRIALTDIFNPEDYYTKVQTDNLLGNKVDKEQGKGLSSNDYTTEEKNKVANIPTALSQLTDDATHRTVSDTEKNTWNNKGDISGITMNGVSKGTSGVVDLGNVLTTVATLVQESNQNPVTSNAVYQVLNSIELIIAAALNDLKDSVENKENLMPITTTIGTTLTAVVGNYYRLDNVSTLTITLPTIVEATKLQAITFMIICGSSALVTFLPQDNETIRYQEDFALEDNTTYEVTALWNGSEWTLSRVIYR